MFICIIIQLFRQPQQQVQWVEPGFEALDERPATDEWRHLYCVIAGRLGVDVVDVIVGWGQIGF